MSEFEKRRKAAIAEIQRLIDSGARAWRMSIPVEEDRDSDTILGAVVSDSKQLQRERDEARAEIQKWQKAARTTDGVMRTIEEQRDALREAIQDAIPTLTHVDQWHRVDGIVQRLKEALAGLEGEPQQPSWDEGLPEGAEEA